jgi:aerobic-type carbon monoxide dehydrogenase small subunit (CoxS/CutS family)
MVFVRNPAQRPVVVSFTVDGEVLTAPKGEPLATALAVTGRLKLRASPQAGTPRGGFCFMGVCQECAIHVDGVLRQACLVSVLAGMRVELRGAP